MAVYSYAQLEELWIQAGGSRTLAPLMAAIAMAESGGNSQAENPSGATGLWQILGNPFPGNAFDPLTNAKMAVAKWRTQGLGAWVTYTSGAYQQFYKGDVPPGQLPQGGGGGSGGGGTPAQLDAFLGGGSGGVLSDAGALLHGTAVILDRAFGLFAPGQGWRIVFGAAAILLFIGSYRAFGGTVAL